LFAAARMRDDRRAIGWVLRAAAWGTLALVAASVAFGAADFERFFSAFHGLFFAAGTWTFPEGSLLIQLFPEPLWAAFGALWAAGVLLGVAALLATARALARPGRGQAREEV
jgi:uncharacterized membrane protein